jgi:hypothetical protein
MTFSPSTSIFRRETTSVIVALGEEHALSTRPTGENCCDLRFTAEDWNSFSEEFRKFVIGDY